MLQVLYTSRSCQVFLHLALGKLLIEMLKWIHIFFFSILNRVELASLTSDLQCKLFLSKRYCLYKYCTQKFICWWWQSLIIIYLFIYGWGESSLLYLRHRLIFYIYGGPKPSSDNLNIVSKLGSTSWMFLGWSPNSIF